MHPVFQVFLEEFIASFGFNFTISILRTLVAKAKERKIVPKHVLSILNVTASIRFISAFSAAYPRGLPNPALRIADGIAHKQNIFSIIGSLSGIVLGCQGAYQSLMAIVKKLDKPLYKQVKTELFGYGKQNVDEKLWKDPNLEARVLASELLSSFGWSICILVLLKRGRPLPAIAGLLAIVMYMRKLTGVAPAVDVSALIAKSALQKQYMYIRSYIGGTVFGSIIAGTIMRDFLGQDSSPTSLLNTLNVQENP